MTFSETVSGGLGVDLSQDDYRHSLIGLTQARSGSLAGDLSVAVSDATQLRLYAQAERTRSLQAGSQQFGQPDWTGRIKDAVDLAGIGITHSAMKGRLELGGDLVSSRSRSNTSIEIGASGSPFPTATTALDSLKLFATWRMNDKLSILGSWWYERYDAEDWHLDGVLPASVPNLLAFGEQPPRYHVNVVRVTLRYRWN